MKTFLTDIADELLKDGRSDFSGTCIVLPNRRAGVFLRKALSDRAERTIWAPAIRSIEDFVFELAGTTRIDRVSLLFIFYQVYQESVKDPQSLEVFANWAPTFLSDINELDQNLIDASNIYENLHSVERIAAWNPETGQATERQKKYLAFVAEMHGFYVALRKKLEADRMAYQGMAFRHVAENIDALTAASDWKTVWFAGFNALTVAEEAIIAYYAGSGGSRVFWDMDRAYADDPVHEAGHYIRKYCEGKGKFKIDGEFNWKRDGLFDESKHVLLIGAERKVAQAQIAASIIAKAVKNHEGSLSDTAVVLNDEALLIPLLHALPLELKGVNITMGYGLQNAQCATFIEKIFALYDRFGQNGNRFYHQDVAAVVHDRFYISMPGTGLLATQLSKEKQIYLSASQLAESPVDKLLFNEQMATVGGFLKGLQAIVNETHRLLMEEGRMQIEMEFLFLFDRLLQRITDLIGQVGGIDTIRMLHVFWRQLVRSQQLDFVGEPLQGLQVMGMLETRNLDFKNVIVLSVNEGQLPSTHRMPSYFTYDVRKVFGLACQNERDAVTAYHFYRLLQRAQNIYLIYDKDTNAFGGGEVSRYVQQLQLHIGKEKLKPWNIAQNIPSRPFAIEITIEKKDKEVERLLDHCRSGLSPSALNTYRNCPLQYYFKYVAGFKEQHEFNENIDSAILGTAVHHTLDKLYRPFIGRALTKDGLLKMKNLIRGLLGSEFKELLANDGTIEGRNLLAFDVGLSYVKRVIAKDIKTIEAGTSITPLALEEKLTGEIEVPETDQTVRIEGSADRIDRLSDGTVRVIDYKTGSFNKTSSIDDVAKFEQSKTDHAFQLLMYAMMYSMKQEIPVDVRPTVFYLRWSQVEKQIEINVNKEPVEGQSLILYAKERLLDVLRQMLDTRIPFCQTEDVKRCAYCDFNQICQR